MDHERFMGIALADAEVAGERGDRPIACVIVHGDTIIARGSSLYVTANSAVHHAENTAVLSCAAYLRSNGPECVLYTTLEPCVMCLGTILMGNIRNIVFALEDKYMRPKENMTGFTWVQDRIFNYICGVRRDESRRLIETYCDENDRRIILDGGRP